MKEKINIAIEGIEYGISHAGKRTNSNILSKLKDSLNEFLNGDFSKIDEFKSILVTSHPNSAAPDNDVLLMDVLVGGKSVILDNILMEIWMEYNKQSNPNTERTISN